VRLIHQTKGNAAVGAIYFGQLGPERNEVIIGDARLTYDAAVPASVIMTEESVSQISIEGVEDLHINQAELSPGIQASLHQLIIDGKICLV